MSNAEDRKKELESIPGLKQQGRELEQVEQRGRELKGIKEDQLFTLFEEIRKHLARLEGKIDSLQTAIQELSGSR